MPRGFLLLLVFPALLNAQVNTLADSWKNDRHLKGASYGFCVLNTRTSEVIAEHNAQELLIPASTLKVITTYAALSLLGPDYHYETKLLYTGTVDKTSGVLNGDLIIAGSGDPSLQSEYFGKENVTDSWAKVLKANGLKEITGKIIGDASAYERSVPAEWTWGDIGNYYGATSCGLAFMDNKFRIYYSSGETGSEAKITGTSPEYSSRTYSLSSSVIAKGSEDEAYVYGDPFSFVKEIKGVIPPNKTNYEVEAALPDPALLCAEALCTSLEKAGIKCSGNAAQSNYTKDAFAVNKKPLHTHYSPALRKLVFYTNLKSSNPYCESLLRTLGKGKAGNGIEAVRSFCRLKGVDTDQVFMADGCGLSRANTVSASFIAQLLAIAAKDTALYNVMKSSFPAAGKSGSMSSIGKGTFIEDNLHAKTGYINRVRAYCGYVKTRSGKELAFSVMLNNYNCSAKEAKLKLEKFMVALGEL